MLRIWMRHATHEQVMSHMKESCHAWTIHVTYVNRVELSPHQHRPYSDPVQDTRGRSHLSTEGVPPVNHTTSHMNSSRCSTQGVMVAGVQKVFPLWVMTNMKESRYRRCSLYESYEWVTVQYTRYACICIRTYIHEGDGCTYTNRPPYAHTHTLKSARALVLSLLRTRVYRLKHVHTRSLSLPLKMCLLKMCL